MPTFIKTGFWERQKTGYDGWLNLEDLINLLIQQSGGGGSQNLQSVLNNGKTATFENSTIEILSGTPNDRFFDIIIKNFDETVFSRFTVSNYGIAIDSGDSNVNAYTNIENGKLSFVQNDVINSGTIAVIFPEQINEGCVLTFPAKPTGTYTLATLDDIPSGGNQDLQSVLNVNNLATNTTIILQNNSAEYTTVCGTNFIIQKNTGTGFLSGILSYNEVQFHDTETSNIVHITSGNNTNAGEIIFNLPNKIAGTYILATTEDIIVSPIKTVGTNSLFSVIPLAGVGITTLDSSIFFGDNAGSNATAANSSNFLGRGAGREATNASDSNFFGFSAGFFAVNAQNSNFIGNSAGSSANNASFSNFLGREAGRNASGANNSNFLGVRAGFNATDALNSNFLGKNAGNGASLAEYSNLFGFNVGQTYAGNNIGPNNIIIGTNISLPNGVANAINIGGVIFGFNTHSTVTGDPSITNTINGRVGINKAIDNNVDTLQIGGTLNIGTVGTGPSINNLGIDANGQVVVGTSGGSTIPVSGTQSGIVNNVALQELGGVDKLINEVRIGRGNGNDSNNLVYGYGTLAANTTGVYNLAIGSEVMAKLTTGNNNVGVGHYALYEIISGIYNTAVGQGALQDNLGSFNDAFGAYALGYNSTGQYNTAIGNAALSENRFGSQNVAVGAYALYLTQGVNGSESQGARCVAIGTKAMENNTTGNGTAVGNEALLEQTTGSWNIAIGQKAGSAITTGSNNIVITVNGVNPNSGITTGNNNLLIAQNFGGINPGITTASGNTILGRVLFSLVGNIDNQVFLADGTGTASGLRFKSDTNGLCTIPTQSNTNINNDVSGFAILTKGYITTLFTSPTFTGIPIAPTAVPGTNTTQIATTGFVTNALTTSLSDVVTKSGPQDISGFKTFTTGLKAKAGILLGDFGSGISSDSINFAQFGGIGYTATEAVLGRFGLNIAVRSANSMNYFAGLDTSLITYDRNFNFPDKDGTIALLSDIPSLKRRKDVKYFAAGNIPQGTVLGGNFEEILYQDYKLIKIVVVFGEQSMNTNKTIPFEIKTIDTDSAAPVATLQYTANCNAVVGAIQNKRYIFDVDVTLPADKLLTVNTGAFTASTQILNNCLVTLVLEEI